jgi:hypothetical protein
VTDVTVTFFRDRAAKTKNQRTLDAVDLIRYIDAVHADRKEALPWLKLASFGNNPSDKGCLRHDGNVVAIHGVEGDYDDGEISLAEAKDRAVQSGLLCIIYPSPSYTPEAPKWRVLCPTSKPYQPAMRDTFMNRLNGAFGGIFARESWTLSQSYYFGRVNNPDHIAVVFDGTFIDLATELDKVAIGRPAERNLGAPPHPASRPEDISEARIRGIVNSLLNNIRNAQNGEKHFILRDQALALGGFLHHIGWNEAEAVEQVINALPSADDWDKARKTAQWAIARGVARPLDIDERPHPRSNGDGRHIPDPDTNANGNGADDRNPDTNIGASLAHDFAAMTWLTRTSLPTDRLLGDLITTTTRAFLVGRTGLGKTLLALAMATAIATGTDFLHWRAGRPRRVLYVDGEMPTDLLIDRIRAATQDVTARNLLAHNLLIISLEDAEALAEQYPAIGMFEPLNTDPGQTFIKRLVLKLRPDVIFLDNVQALTAGVQKDEETWIGVLPLISWLTKQRVGQLWLDHTGHNSDRQYGSVVKAWRFDLVGIMAPLASDLRAPGIPEFTLSFDHPGKARRRTPANATDFDPMIIRYRHGQWSAEPAQGARSAKGGPSRKLSPQIRSFYKAATNALTANPTGPNQTTTDAWEAECVRMGLLAPILPSDTGRSRGAKRTPLRKARAALLADAYIDINGPTLILLQAA